MVYGSYVDDRLAGRGAAAVAMLTTFMPEWHEESAKWIDAVLKVAAAESAENAGCIRTWVHEWADRAQASLAPVADLMFGAQGQEILAQARVRLDARCRKAGVGAAA